MDNPYELTDTPNSTETDVTEVASNETPNLADVDDTTTTATGDPIPDSFISLTPPTLTISQAMTPIDISLDDDATQPPAGCLEAGYTDDDPHRSDTFTHDEAAIPPDLDALPQIKPDAVTAAIDDTDALPTTDQWEREFTLDTNLASSTLTHNPSNVDPDPDAGEIASDEEDPDDLDDPTNRAAEATMNISLAALGDTIRQQIEARQQEIDTRLSLLYAQRAELTERIAATGDNAPQGT